MSELDDLDFDDVTLGATSEVGGGIADPINPETTTPQEPAEPEAKKQRGRPKKDATTTGTENVNSCRRE